MKNEKIGTGTLQIEEQWVWLQTDSIYRKNQHLNFLLEASYWQPN